MVGMGNRGGAETERLVSVGTGLLSLGVLEI